MTTEAKSIVHVVFGMSAAGSLRQAFEQMGIKQRVIGFPDDLSFGPINPPDPTLRTTWAYDELGLDDDFWEMFKSAYYFWADAVGPGKFPVAWVNRRCASEFSGFLEFIWRMGDSPINVVDVTGIEYSQSKRRQEPFIINSFGLVTPKQMIESRLIDRQTALTPKDVDLYRADWKRLRTENSPLRVVDATGLVSASLIYFDEMVLSHTTNEWQKCNRVVGQVIIELMDYPYSNCCEFVICSRISVLADAGVLESCGDMSLMHESFVRQIS